MKPLRIAQFVTSTWAQPQPPEVIYAPIHLTLKLTEQLQARGHNLTVYAPQGSHVPGGQLETLGLTPLEQDQSTPYFYPGLDRTQKNTIRVAWKQYFIQQMLQAAADGAFDLVHIHAVDFALPLARAYPTVPVVYTLHDPIEWRHQLYRLFSSPNQWFVSVSDSQRRPAPDLQYAATVYNGVETDRFPFSSRPGTYLLYVGRLMPEKGVSEAIKVAQALGEELKIIGPTAAGPSAPDHYWKTEIEPHLNEKIQYLGTVNRTELPAYYQNAKALLMPIQWEEPFGLVMTEALACGTPVIAFRRGSVPEVVRDGQTGFVVDTTDDMIAAVKNIPTLSRQACRDHVEQNFSFQKMVEGYEQAYYAVLAASTRR